MFTQAITIIDAANIPGALHGQILALPPFLPRSQLTGLKPTRLSLAALPTPLLHHPSPLYKHHGQKGVNIGHLQTTTDSGKF